MFRLMRCTGHILDVLDVLHTGRLAPLPHPAPSPVAADFPKQVTHTVVWLSEMNLDIDLIQVGLWKVQDQLVAGLTKLYPTPEVEEFTLAPARIETKAATQKLKERSRARKAVHVLVEAGLLPDGPRMRLVPRHGVTESIREAIHAWVGEDGSRGAATWNNGAANQLTWKADGGPYSPTGLANHILTSVTGRKADGIQGTTWWDVDTNRIPDTVAPEDWAALAGVGLARLAKQLSGSGKDWTTLHSLLAALPSGRWTTYGDVATAVGSHAVPIGTHLATWPPGHLRPVPQRVAGSERSGTSQRRIQVDRPHPHGIPRRCPDGRGRQLRHGAADPSAHVSVDALRSLLRTCSRGIAVGRPAREGEGPFRTPSRAPFQRRDIAHTSHSAHSAHYAHSSRP